MEKKKWNLIKWHHRFFLVFLKAPKEEHLLSRVCERSVCLWQRSGEGRRTDTEKMNSGILNIKDDRVPQQLLLFIFLWKHLDTHIHLYSCHTPSFSPSPSVSSCHTLFFPLSRSPPRLHVLHVKQPQLDSDGGGTSMQPIILHIFFLVNVRK